jgi:hypothetical protein
MQRTDSVNPTITSTWLKPKPLSTSQIQLLERSSHVHSETGYAIECLVISFLFLHDLPHYFSKERDTQVLHVEQSELKLFHPRSFKMLNVKLADFPQVSIRR